MSYKTIHQHAFWLYGVIVGLALKEALAGSVPHIIGLFQADGSGLWEPEAARLFIFLTLIIRFYLGSALYFNLTYINPVEPLEDNPDKTHRAYFVDFLFGLIHFLFFFGLALTIEVHNAPINAYRGVLGLILLYDFLWLIAARYRHRILRWTIMNVFTVIIAVIVFKVSRNYLRAESLEAEMYALVPVAFMSFLDIAETTIGRPIVAKWITGLGNKLQRLGGWMGHIA